MREPASCPGGQSGFTLIEVVVALALLATVMTTIFGIHSTGLDGLARVDEGERAAIVADGLLAQLGTITPVSPGQRLTGRAGEFLWTIRTEAYGDEAGQGPGTPPRPDRLVVVRIAVARPQRPPFELATLKLVTPPPVERGAEIEAPSSAARASPR